MRQSINVMFNPEVSGLIPFVPADDMPPKYYTAIQSWALCFLTTTGTRLLDPEYGTMFLPLLQSGNLFSEDDVYSAFSVATSRCYTYCQPDSVGDVYVVNARISALDVELIDDDRRLVIYVAFAFSDGEETRINLEVK